MADDTADDRWTVRGIPKHVREAIAAAAQRRKVSVGEWACEAFDRHIQAEREPVAQAIARPADRPADMADVPSDADAQLALIERAVNAAVALAGAAAVPVAFRRRANRLLRDSLPTPAGRPSRGKPTLLLAGGTDAAD